jgi:hypothetical protein
MPGEQFPATNTSYQTGLDFSPTFSKHTQCPVRVGKNVALALSGG